VDFALSASAQEYVKRIEDFMYSHMYPAEKA